MANDNSTVVAVRARTFHGEKLLGDTWHDFIVKLRQMLKRYGLEAADSSNELLLFSFNQPFSALASYFECLEAIKTDNSVWNNSQDKVPVQIIFHLEKKGEVQPPIRETASKIWNTLQHETPYVTRTLKLQWDKVMAGKGIPAHHFEKEGDGLFKVIFSNDAKVKSEKIFQHRDLVAHGKHKECFYCGMRAHTPNACPSKLLTTDMRSISEIGYLAFSEFNEHFKKSFTNQTSVDNVLKAGTDAAQIRKDPTLRTYISYFDHSMVYQLRFLWHMAFTSNTSWDGAAKQERITIDSRSLQMGLDCLRVGKYKEAIELLRNENQLMAGKQFYANIGLAFVSMEMGRTSDVLQYFEIAKGTAENEKERIYISLLISRFFDLAGHSWKADHAIQSIYNLYVDCVEAQYRKVQISVRNGEGETAVKLLQKLTKGYRHIFMTALMDPILFPIQGMVEDLLTAQIQIQLQNAQESLIQARQECETLRTWFDSEDPDLLAILQTLEHLEEQFQRKSYFDLLDVAEKAKAMAKSSPLLKDNKLDELNEEVDKIVIRWGEYNTYWKLYPYKLFFNKFHEVLLNSKRKLVETRTLAATSFGKAVTRFNAAKEEISSMRHFYKKMHNLKNLFDMAGVFGKKLVFAEFVLTGIVLLLYPLFAFTGLDLFGTGFIDLIKDPNFQRKGFLVICFLVAPLFAFAQTLQKANRT